MAKLVSESKEFPGLSVELSSPKAGVGRADGNELQVLHGSVSSRHKSGWTSEFQPTFVTSLLSRGRGRKWIPIYCCMRRRFLPLEG